MKVPGRVPGTGPVSPVLGMGHLWAGAADVHRWWGGARRLAPGGGTFWGGPSARGSAVPAGEAGPTAAPRDVHFVTELPMTAADKIDKQALRGRYHHK